MKRHLLSLVEVHCSVSDPYSLNPNPAKNLNPDPDPDPSYFFTLFEKKIEITSLLYVQ